MITRTPSPSRVVLLLLLTGLGAAGCSSDTQPAAAPPTAASSAASAASGAEPAASEAAPVAIDACSLISPEDISALLGVTVEGVSTSNLPETPACTWENPANDESVSVDIGSPDTAINGTLPPLDPAFAAMATPGPDGMRFMGDGVVDFVAGRRLNSVQVAVLSMLGGQASDAAVDLARKIGPQIPE